MKDIFITFFSKNYKFKDNYEYEKISYGLEIIYLNISKLFVIIVISIFLNILKETIFVIFFLGILKMFAYGIQMDKSYKCYIFSIFIYNILPFLFKHISTKPMIIYVFILSLISFILFSPSDTKNRPLLKNRLKKKILSTLLLIIYFALIYFFRQKKIVDYILLSIIIESIIITPFIYKIFGFPYNNYKEVILWILY